MMRKKNLIWILCSVLILSGCSILGTKIGQKQKTHPMATEKSYLRPSVSPGNTATENPQNKKDFPDTSDETKNASSAKTMPKTEDYTLTEVVILSRHNIRSPLTGSGSVLQQITPHKWFDWTSQPGELSLRGGTLETMMGQYFRKYLEKENFMPENYIPKKQEFRFYANAKQRTIATTQYFSSGLLPVANVKIEHHGKYNSMDDVFNPKLTFSGDAYKTAATKQMANMFGTVNLSGIASPLEDNYRLLENVIDLKKSEAFQSGECTDFKTDDTSVNFEIDQEPQMQGTLKTTSQISDALILQYYEEENEKKAAFGKTLNTAQWENLAEIKDHYQKILFTAPLIAVNVAHPLLKEIKKELLNPKRKFSFLCGHDSNISSVLAALGCKSFELPDAIEKTTPIGGKLVFKKWKSKKNKNYISVEMIYQSTGQLRKRTLLTPETPPRSFPLEFDGIKKNSDGLYRFNDIKKQLTNAIGRYTVLRNKYGQHKKAA